MAKMAESNHDRGTARTQSNGAPEYDSALDNARRSMALTRDEYGSLPGLPRLEYRLMEHKMKLFVVSGLLIFEGSLLPIVLFYPLWYLTNIRHGIREYTYTTVLP